LLLRLRISARADQERVELSVTDQRVGLTPDEEQRLGQRSFCGTRHLHRVPGTGLGLWIADTFVMTNGGTLDAESPRPWLGTAFSIHLPAAKEAEGVAEAMSWWRSEADSGFRPGWRLPQRADNGVVLAGLIAQCFPFSYSSHWETNLV
jgi:hypothetical protein